MYSEASDAAEALGITSERLKELGLIDQIIPEPLGGAHRDIAMMTANVKQVLAEQLDELGRLDIDQLVGQRYERLMSFGNFETK